MVNKKIKSILYIIILASIILVTASSCLSKTDEAEGGGIIPENDLVEILIDVHLADGILNIPRIRKIFELRDSLSNYSDIIVSHGYTQEIMDKTIRYYFVRKPKKLVNIYDKVLGHLSEMESLYMNLISGQILTESNKWTGKPSYYFPDPSGNDDSSFEIPLDQSGYFTLTFAVTLSPADQSFNPEFSGCIIYKNITGEITRMYLPSMKYIKDGYPHTYVISGRVAENVPATLQGSLFFSGNDPDYGTNQVRIDNIAFSYIPGY